MSEIDDKLKYNDRRNGSDLYFVDGGVYLPNQLRDHDRDLAIQDYLNTHSATNITSRDQIVNPVELLSQMEYGNSAKERKRYEEDLAILEELQKQQQASYDEWYNSPEQQNIRDRAAGLNTDILGLSGSETAQTPVGGADPLANVPSTGEQFTNIASGITSLVSGVASMASLPSAFANFKLLNSQVHAQELQNLKDFESLAGGEISSRLSDSISTALDSGDAAFDIASWFADEKNFEGIFESYSPNDNHRYRSSFANVRKRMQQNLGRAYEQGKVTNENKSSFAAMAADPRYSSDFLIQVAATKPYMEAQLKAEKAIADYQAYLNEWNLKYQEGLNVDTAVDVANSRNEYDSEYYAALDAEKSARYQNLMNEVEAIGLELERAIRSNYKTLYEGNENNLTGVSVAYLYRNAPTGWKDFYLVNSHLLIEQGANVNPSTGLPNTGSVVQNYLYNPTGAAAPPDPAYNFIPPGAAIVR